MLNKLLLPGRIILAAVAALIVIAIIPMTMKSKVNPVQKTENKSMTLNKLTPEEERVIIHKGTERASEMI